MSRMSFCAFLTVMPFCRTSCGSCGSASFTWFCTSTAARSWFRSMLKNTERFIVPSLPFADV